MFCSSFVFQSGICPVPGFLVVHTYMCKSLLMFHCFGVGFLYSALCSHSTEFSGTSKPGLYFCCKVQVFAICLEAVCAFMFLD